MSRKRVLTWNVYIGHAPAHVRSMLLVLIALTWPHVIVLQEAQRFAGGLPGYRRHAADPKLREDADNCVVFTRRGQKVTRSRAVAVPEPEGRWTFRQPKPARVWRQVVIDGWLGVLDVHRCVWGRARNRLAWVTEDETLRIVAGTLHDVEALAMVGDWNDPAESTWSRSPRALAKRIGGHIATHSPSAIDYAVVRGCRARSVRLGRKYGSDHAPKLVTIRRVRG